MASALMSIAALLSGLNIKTTLIDTFRGANTWHL